MKNLKVSMKLIISFLIVISLTISVGAVGIAGMKSMSQAATDMYSHNLLGIESLGNLREMFNSQRSNLNSILVHIDNAAYTQALFADVAADDKQALEEFAIYEATIQDIGEQTAYLEAKALWQGEYAAFKADFEALIKTGDLTGALTAIDNAEAMFATIIGDLNNAALFNNDEAYSKDKQGDALFATLLTVMIAIIIIAAGIALALAFYVSGLISKPLALLTAFMKKASSTGDITIRAEDESTIKEYSHVKDEIGQCISASAQFVSRITEVSEKLETIAENNLDIQVNLLSGDDKMGRSLQKMVDNLNAMFGEINSAALQVATGSEQIAGGAQALAQGSTQQAATVQQLSASITEIADETRVNSEMAGQAAQLARSIKQNAEKGSHQMDEMMAAVKEINEASENIGKVIKVIDNIAFQTNILALNAAVEAARAGQHGKGFSVVAEEVRNLAAKSSEAAKETGEMIANTIEKAHAGARIASETAASLAEIVSGIGESTTIVGEIAKTSEHQNVSISQINEGIDQVAQVVQQNSATAEESAAASEELNGQSNMLEQLISRFRLREENMIHQTEKSFAKLTRRAASQESGFALSTRGKY